MRSQIAILAITESLVVFVSYYAGVALRFGGNLEMAGETSASLTPKAAAFTLIAVASLLSMGLYRARQSDRYAETLARLAGAFVATALVDAAVYYLIPEISISRSAQLLALSVAFAALILTRWAFRVLLGHDRFKRNVLVYGQGTTAAMISRLRAMPGQSGFRIVGFLGVFGHEASAECQPSLARTKTLLELVRDEQIDEIVVAMDDRRDSFPMRELLDCRLAGVKISEALTFAERVAGRIDLEALHPSWLIFGHGFRRGTIYGFAKRFFDIVASLVVLVLALPLLALGAAAILVESRGKGSVLLRQERVGLNGEVFSMLKLRSMVPDAEGDGRARWTSENDPRITRVGALLRRFRIDELPQALNVLKGEMSFVGPRPERPEFVDELSKEIPFYRERHCVKPGIAGWAQLCYPYGASLEDARQKLQYELFYVKNYSPVFDLIILFETLEVVLWGSVRAAETSVETAAAQAPESRAA